MKYQTELDHIIREKFNGIHAIMSWKSIYKLADDMVKKLS